MTQQVLCSHAHVIGASYVFPIQSTHSPIKLSDGDFMSLENATLYQFFFSISKPRSNNGLFNGTLFSLFLLADFELFVPSRFLVEIFTPRLMYVALNGC